MVDMRELLQPERDAQVDEDLAAVKRALDALHELSGRWEQLPVGKHAEYRERWRQRMYTLEEIPRRFFRSHPTIGQRAEWLRIVEQAGSLTPLMERLGLYVPDLR